MESVSDPVEYVDAERLPAAPDVVLNLADRHLASSRYMARREAGPAPLDRYSEHGPEITLTASAPEVWSREHITGKVVRRTLPGHDQP
jgi:hypothetical protein